MLSRINTFLSYFSCLPGDTGARRRKPEKEDEELKKDGELAAGGDDQPMVGSRSHQILPMGRRSPNSYEA